MGKILASGRPFWESSVSGIMGVILNKEGSSIFLKTENTLELLDVEWEIIRIFGDTYHNGAVEIMENVLDWKQLSDRFDWS